MTNKCININYGIPSIGSGPRNCGCSTTGCSCTPGCSSSPAGNGIGLFEFGDNPLPVTALTPLSAFKAVVIANGGVQYADNLNPAHEAIVVGVLGASAAAGQMASVYWGGPLTNGLNGIGGWNFSIGGAVYVGTNGDLTQVVPTSGFKRAIGFALSANTILITPYVVNATAPDLRVGSAPYAATMTLDANVFDVVNTLLTGSPAIDITGGTDGQEFVLRLTQDAGGGRTVLWGPHVGFIGSAPVLSTVGGKTDQLRFQYVASVGKFVLVGAEIGL